MRVRVLLKYWGGFILMLLATAFGIHAAKFRDNEARTISVVTCLLVLSSAFYIILRLTYLEFRFARGGLRRSVEYLIDLSDWRVSKLGPISGKGPSLISISLIARSAFEWLWPTVITVSLEQPCAKIFMPFKFRTILGSRLAVTVVITQEPTWSTTLAFCRSASVAGNPFRTGETLVRVEVWGRASNVQMPNRKSARPEKSDPGNETTPTVL